MVDCRSLAMDTTLFCSPQPLPQNLPPKGPAGGKLKGVKENG